MLHNVFGAMPNGLLCGSLTVITVLCLYVTLNKVTLLWINMTENRN